MSLQKPAAVWGTFREGGLDRYTFDARAGERICFEAVANRLGKDADPLITIRDPASRFVAQRDNDAGLYFDSRFEHVFDKAGTYTLEIRDARFKRNEHWTYALRVGKFPPARVVVPAAEEIAGRLPGPCFHVMKRPDDDGSSWMPTTTAEGPILLAPENGEPTPAAAPCTICGVLRKPGIRHLFTFKLDKGQKLFVRGEDKAINSPVDLELVLFDKAGKEVKRHQEAKRNPRAEIEDEVTLEYTANAAGEFQLAVRDGFRDGGEAFAYRLTVRPDSFPPQLEAEVEGLVVPQGSYQIVPITVTRSPGTKGTIALKLLGAPPGMTLTPNEIAESANAVVCKLEASTSAKLGVHTLQILAECEGSRSLVQCKPLVDRRHVNEDLIPIALREDQRRLPPSVADRFALQITPTSPFTFELPEPELTLVRYQRVGVPLAITRVPGFDGPITFTAKGGQLAPKEEGRTRVYAEFPAATPATPRAEGFIQSLILSNLAKARIEVSAMGTHQGRRVTLTRSFELDLVPGFRVKGEPAKLSVFPGETARTRFTVERIGGIDNEITILFNRNNGGLELPETLVIPRGQTGVDFAIAIPADTAPRKFNIQATSSGDVNGYEEEIRGSLVEIEVKKPDVPKKK
jgi:hypothetical protein